MVSVHNTYSANELICMAILHVALLLLYSSYFLYSLDFITRKYAQQRNKHFWIKINNLLHRAVIKIGEGKAFCTGLDAKSVALSGPNKSLNKLLERPSAYGGKDGLGNLAQDVCYLWRCVAIHVIFHLCNFSMVWFTKHFYFKVYLNIGILETSKQAITCSCYCCHTWHVLWWRYVEKEVDVTW